MKLNRKVETIFFYGCFFNPFLANIPILYILKTTEKQRCSGVFSGYKMETLNKIDTFFVHQMKITTKATLCKAGTGLKNNFNERSIDISR